jgi:DNA-binding transcriptional LysR family regulator
MQDVQFVQHLPVFVDAVRSGSFSAAARARSVTPSAIARQIDALEAALGTRLFVRSTRMLRLTDAGQVLLERVTTILDALTDTRAEVASVEGRVSGVLRIACLPTFGKRFLIPATEALMQQHQQLRVELDLTERLADPVAERMDAVIRIGVQPDSSLVATRLATQRMTLCASPDYLARAGMPDGPAVLAQHRLLDKLHGADLLGWQHVVGADVLPMIARQTVFRCDEFEGLRDAACRGLGIVRLASWVTWQDVAAGRLVPVLPEHRPAAEPEDQILLLRPPFKPAAKLRVFVEALKAWIGTPPIWERCQV